jgi:hypothetical protein
METAQTFDAIFAQAAGALQSAMANHGEEAVEVAMLVYRLEAARIVAIGAFCFIIGAALLAFSISVIRQAAKINALDSDTVGGTIIVLFVATIILGLSGRWFFSIYAWMAVFGNPDAFITAKALQAAGLL